MKQEERLRSLKEPLELRYIRNAAVLPECRPRPKPSTPPVATGSQVPDGPLTIHGYSVDQYKQLYHSVVDPLLLTPSGRPRPYSLALGRQIKQQLWQKLFCPSFTCTPQPDGRQQITESFGVRMYAPRVDLDVSGEPECEKPPRKRAKH